MVNRRSDTSAKDSAVSTTILWDWASATFIHIRSCARSFVCRLETLAVLYSERLRTAYTKTVALAAQGREA